MIKSKTAFTYELDDLSAAVEDILSQLQGLTLNEKMIGIVTCSYDFIELGVINALQEALPFDIIGETTISQAVSGSSGLIVLTMMVLYSDDCSFCGALSGVIPQKGDMRGAIENEYNAAAEKLGEKVSLIFAFPPLLNAQPGDEYVNILSSLSSHAPVFGSICADDQPDTYSNSHTIYRDKAYRDRMTFILISGEVEPEFKIISVSSESQLPYKGEITKSDANILMGINDMAAVDYLETIGLAHGGKIRSGISSIPFLISFGNESGRDGIPIARALFMTTIDNYAICGGEMPVGSSITVGVCDKNDVLKTTRTVLENISATCKGKNVLMFSCLGRRLSLGGEPMLEVEMASEVIGSDVNFMLSYSSGEICPTSSTDNKAINRFHNYTFVTCIF